jgi:diguanylate cyclase (GGDEF)-like protein
LISYQSDMKRTSLPTALRRLRSLNPWLRWYALAVGLSALALLLMLLLRPLMESSIFFLFVAAVAISAMYGGLGPGLMASLISALEINYFFLLPYNALLSSTEDTLQLVVFLATGVIISWLAQSHKRAKDQLRARNEDLEGWVTLRRLLEQQLEWRVSHDYLTDLHNQGAFYEHLRRALSRARRQGTEVALLFMDLDGFKLINDSLGHQEGDLVLREVARRLKECLREEDIAARIGGDELVVLLEDVADASSAVKVAERFQEQLRIPLDAHTNRLAITASIGIAVGARWSPEGLVRAADQAMYQAKRAGKASSVVFDPNSTSGYST